MNIFHYYGFIKRYCCDYYYYYYYYFIKRYCYCYYSRGYQQRTVAILAQGI